MYGAMTIALFVQEKAMLINGYTTSNDYEALFELMQTRNVICYVDYNRFSSEEIEPLWDVCEAVMQTEYHLLYELVSQGYCYFKATTKEEFIEKCQRNKVRFVSPLTSSLLELFTPMIFESPEALHVKAKELDCIPFKDADDIQYLKSIAAKMYKNGHRLFYFKKSFTNIEIEHLLMADNFDPIKKNENIFISGNHNTGVLYVVENEGKKDKEDA